eukprot:TRINITY_DN13223_c1_g1_i1.p1 TRINITY_DN13223_c1_g1~~TRINITY_DN13223_c1_g1_i1.p1  ORF type:complete len:673 (+),score=178.11 TRINITY_DN13223_c1_g1_i1:112-2019(+)
MWTDLDDAGTTPKNSFVTPSMAGVFAALADGSQASPTAATTPGGGGRRARGSFVIAPAAAAQLAAEHTPTRLSAAACAKGAIRSENSPTGERNLLLMPISGISGASSGGFSGAHSPRLRCVSERELGISPSDLSTAFTTPPPPLLQPEHANRARHRSGDDGRRERERRERRQREQQRVADSAHGVRPGYVELFLRCYVGRQVPEGAFAALREFLSSVPPATAEANQQAALDLYMRELKAAVAAGRGKRDRSGNSSPVEPRGDAMDVLRASLAARVAEPGSALSKEKEKDLFCLSVGPRHFAFDSAEVAARGGRIFEEVSIRNPGHRSMRFWVHDPALYAGCRADEGVDFRVLVSGAGTVTVKKRDRAPVHVSLIFAGDAACGARETAVLETEFGFRHFLSVTVARRAGQLYGTPLHILGVMRDPDCGPPGCCVPAPLVALRRAIVASDGLLVHDLFGALGTTSSAALQPTADARPCVESGGELELVRFGAHTVAAALLHFLQELPGRVLGTVDTELLESLVFPLLARGDPLGVVHALPAPDASVLLWLLHLLSEVLQHSNENGSSARVLAAAVAPSIFVLPSPFPGLKEQIAVTQQVAQLLVLLIAAYRSDIYSAPGVHRTRSRSESIPRSVASI